MTNNTQNAASDKQHSKFKQAKNPSQEFLRFCSEENLVPTRRAQSKFNKRGLKKSQAVRQR